MGQVRTFKVLQNEFIGNDFNNSQQFDWYCEPIYIGAAKKIRAIFEIHSIGNDDRAANKTTYVQLFLPGAASNNANTQWTVIDADGNYPDPTVTAAQEDQVVLEYVRFSTYQLVPPTGGTDPLLRPWLKPNIRMYRSNNMGYGAITCSLTIVAEYD